MLHIVTLDFWLLFAFCYYIWRMCFFYHRISPAEARAWQRTTTDNKVGDPGNCSACYTETLYTFTRTQVRCVLGGNLTLPGISSFKKFMRLINCPLLEGFFVNLYSMERWDFFTRDLCLGF